MCLPNQIHPDLVGCLVGVGANVIEFESPSDRELELYVYTVLLSYRNSAKCIVVSLKVIAAETFD